MEEWLLKEMITRAWENESYSLIALVILQIITNYRLKKIGDNQKSIKTEQEKQTKILNTLSLEVNQNTEYRKNHHAGSQKL